MTFDYLIDNIIKEVDKDRIVLEEFVQLVERGEISSHTLLIIEMLLDLQAYLIKSNKDTLIGDLAFILQRYAKK